MTKTNILMEDTSNILWDIYTELRHSRLIKLSYGANEKLSSHALDLFWEVYNLSKNVKVNT